MMQTPKAFGSVGNQNLDDQRAIYMCSVYIYSFNIANHLIYWVPARRQPIYIYIILYIYTIIYTLHLTICLLHPLQVPIEIEHFPQNTKNTSPLLLASHCIPNISQCNIPNASQCMFHWYPILLVSHFVYIYPNYCWLISYIHVYWCFCYIPLLLTVTSQIMINI